MVMVVGERGDDTGAQAVRLGVGELERSDLFEVVVQQPGVVDQALQDQRFTPRMIGLVASCGLAAWYGPRPRL
jgi:hypothetical protein